MSTENSNFSGGLGVSYESSERNAAGLKPFYSTPEGHPTVATEADLAHTVYESEKVQYDNLIELDRYWAVFPYSYISICQSKNHGELRYFVVEPYLSEDEKELLSFLIDKIEAQIRNYDTQILSSNDRHRRAVIRETAIDLMEGYNMSTEEAIRYAHADSEYITDDFEVEPTGTVESSIQRVLLGEQEEFTPESTECARHAMSCGATASYEYLHLITTLDGHPEYADPVTGPSDHSGSNSHEGVEELDEHDNGGDQADTASDDEKAESSLTTRIKRTIATVHRKFNERGDDAEQELEAEDEYEGDWEDSSEGASESEGEDEIGNPLDGFDEAADTTDWGSDSDSDTEQDSDEETDVLWDGGHTEPEPPSFAESLHADGSETSGGTQVENTEIQYDQASSLPPVEKRFEAYQAALNSDDPTDATQLTTYQIYKLLYYIERQFVGYEKIDAIKNDDTNVEDITVAGYDTAVYVYHKEYGQIRTNIIHGRDELDKFITKLAQMSGEELSRRQPKTDAKLPDGSRAELTLGYEISDTGSQFTIRQFKEVPHTPVDLINWETYGLDQMALLWLFVENGRSIMVAGGTGAGKTTTLNALSLFVPSNNRVVSIEDTPELDLPHENWSAAKTREAGDLTDESVTIDEFDLLKQALRRRPDRIVLGEIRGEEAFELFQSIRTGHPGLTTFHATSFEDVVDRMTSEPIGVPTSLLTALDLILIQGEKRVDGDKVRRNWSISEVEGYQRGFDSNGELTRSEISEWDAAVDSHNLVSRKSIQLEKIQDENGWTADQRNTEIQFRRIVLSALVANEISSYKNVSAVIQAAILDPDQVLEVIAKNTLDEQLGEFTQDLLNINIDTDFGEQNVDRPSPSDEVKKKAESVLRESVKHGLLRQYA